ncbi:MAG: AtpZ/AtpI family protein [bacterium]|nr:AtpZ/AtpI family protein [bacterium]
MEQNKTSEAWWKPAVQIFGQVSTWVVVPIVLALIVGKNLDARYATKPWIFLGLTCLAFLISSFGIVLVITKYMRKIEDNSNRLIGDPPMRREENGKPDKSK